MPRPQRPPDGVPAVEARLREAGLLLPPWLGTPDVRAAFGFKTDSGARQAITRGDFGPYIRRGRRLYLLRESVLAHLRSQQVQPWPR